MRSLRLLTISLVVLYAATFAEASTGVRVVGDPKLRTLATQRIATWLVNHDHQVVETALGDAALAALDQCYLGNELPCANKVFTDNSDADLYVLMNLEVTGAEGRDRVIRATLWLLKSAGAPERYEQTCERCDDAGAAELVEELIAHVGNFDSRSGVLRISSEPAGALVKIDGKSVGATPLDSEQRPGKHRVELSRPGYRPEVREVEVEAGGKHDQVFDLERIPPRSAAWRKPVMYGAAAAGVLAIVGGAIALSMNEGRSCGELPNPPKECLYTLPGGVAALVGGSLALGGATYLWFTRDSSSADHAVAGNGARRSFAIGVAVQF